MSDRSPGAPRADATRDDTRSVLGRGKASGWGTPLHYRRFDAPASTPPVDPAPPRRMARPIDASTTQGATPDAARRAPAMRATRATWIALLTAFIVTLPVLAVVWLALFPRENIWPHLVDTVLASYLLETAGLMIGVAIGTLLIGVSTAWLVTQYAFPGRRLFNWALLLPFAVPAYVIAYVYTDLLEFSGPVQSALRELFGWRLASDYAFPEIRSLPGAIVVMTLVLYPYVFLLARAAFLEQSASIVEATRLLGVGRTRRFLRVVLPMARPAIAVGVAMALMETLNDFGTVDYFAVRTLSAGLYDVWLGMNNLGGGAQIACLMLLFVAMLLTLERISRRHQKQTQSGASRLRPLPRTPLDGSRAALATLACALPVLLGFVVPAWVLLDYAIVWFDRSWTPDFREIAINSIGLSLTAALLATAIGLTLSYARRLDPSRLVAGAVNVAGLGYAVPGAVLAIGVMIPFAAFDNTLDAWMRARFGISTGLLLSGTLFAIVFAYTVRFLAVAYGSVDASMNKIAPSMDAAARSLGHSPFAVLRQVHFPLIRGGLLTAVLVVFVDCMKELPATLVLRPFNVDTLATQVYQYASDESLGQASLGALMIVATGLLPVILLSLSIERTREREAPTLTVPVAPLGPAVSVAPVVGP